MSDFQKRIKKFSFFALNALHFRADGRATYQRFDDLIMSFHVSPPASGWAQDLGQIRCIRAFSEQQKAEVVELNVQTDHVHLLAMVSSKVSISNFVATLKGRTAIRVFNQFRELKHKPYWCALCGALRC